MQMDGQHLILHVSRLKTHSFSKQYKSFLRKRVQASKSIEIRKPSKSANKIKST